MADFSTVLGVPAGTPAALAGVAPPPAAAEPEPSVRGVAELVRDVRRLTDDRFGQVLGLAETMPHWCGGAGTIFGQISQAPLQQRSLQPRDGVNGRCAYPRAGGSRGAPEACVTGDPCSYGTWSRPT
ncbi:hypothetical protein [Streptomyces virginiae]|uniref:hypothetical protein n=1 Tax=Streptomyces virginiae TaxID=1961 RepID=UPI0036F8B671